MLKFLNIPNKPPLYADHILFSCLSLSLFTSIYCCGNLVAQLCPTLSDPMDCNLPGSSVHGIFQARVLEWGAIAFSVAQLVKKPPAMHLVRFLGQEDPLEKE